MTDYVHRSTRRYSREYQYELALQFLAHAKQAGDETNDESVWAFCGCTDCDFFMTAANYTAAFTMAEEFTKRYQERQRQVPPSLKQFFETLGFDVEAVMLAKDEEEAPKPKAMPRTVADFRRESERLLSKIRARGNDSVTAQAEKMVELVLSTAQSIECDDCGEVHP